MSAHVVAASLGHESSTTTIQSHVKPEAVAGAQQRRVMTVLEGGRLTSLFQKKVSEFVELNGIEPSAS